MHRVIGPLRVFVAIALLAAAVWALVEPHVIGVERATIAHPDIPSEFDGVRVVYLSDIHAGPYFSEERVAALLDRVMDERPDMIVFGGDFVGGDSNGFETFYPQAQRLSAPLGMYAVVGNHERREGLARSLELLEANGIRVLNNDNVRVRRGGASIRLAGVDDPWLGQPDIVQAAGAIPADEYAILVSHVPDYFVTGLPRVRGAFDMGLSGHTHGGQATVFGLWAPVVPSRFGQRFSGGWEEVEGIPVLVSRGIGSTGLPVRFFAQPQYHVFTLRHGNASIAIQ